MKQNITINFEEFQSISELETEFQSLINKAKEALQKAYADYSRFYVGAAVLFEDGSVITGNNQENVAYPSGICAERVALFYASAQFPEKKIKAIAVVAKSKNFSAQTPVTPCGACRQVINEYEQKAGQAIKVIMASESGKIIVTEDAKSLLPFVFEASLKS